MSQYTKGRLSRRELDPDPFSMFRTWFADAEAADIIEPNAVVLATATSEGQPSARMVLVKGDMTDGYSFYTNYESRKARELEENPKAALLFFWDRLERQVRIEGTVARGAAADSDDYFATRSRGSQVSASVSPQSRVVGDRAELDRQREEFEAQVGDGPISRPENWGGYRLTPVAFEFWQGGQFRFHDRFRYRRSSPTAEHWSVERLAP